MVVVTPSGCALLRSTSRNCGSQKGSLGVAVSQRGSSGKVYCRASSSLFKPSGQHYPALMLQQFPHLQLMKLAMGIHPGHTVPHGADVPFIQ